MKARRLSLSILTCTAGLLGSALIAVPPSEAAPVVVHGPRVPWPLTGWGGRSGVRSSWASSNWSGYAETGSFTGVSGTWTVPSVSPGASASTYSAAWIGVDGFNDDDLIQTGTEQDYYGGSAHYSAWWEILPAAETVISETVAPGDRMSASIYETTTTSTTRSTPFRRRQSTGNIWVINIADATQGWSFSINEAYSGPGTSAEWVVEAPEVGFSIATLSDYTFSGNGVGTTTGDFDNAGTLAAPVSSGTPTYTPAALNYANDSGVLVQNNEQVSTPGEPDSALTAFNMAYGATAPAAPSS